MNSRVQKHRDALRSAGLRPVQIWVPDTRKPDFAEECKRQVLTAAKSDIGNSELSDWLDKAASDIGGWTD